MKSLRFVRLELLSRKERKALSVEFHPKLTVLTGENDVGKSSVIKSLYWTLGADVSHHQRWKDAQVKSLLTFTVDGRRYSALRDGKTFAIFDQGDNLLIATASVTRELGPFVAGLLDFGLTLSNRNGDPEIPPPAFAFLPFYVDQDLGWTQPLGSFLSLGQYARYREAVVNFHSGILPNEFYKLQAEKRKLSLDRDELLRDRSVIDKAVEKLGLASDFPGLELSNGEYEKSTEEFLRRLRTLRDQRHAKAVQLAGIVDERALIDEQMRIARAVLSDVNADVNWLARQDSAEILCPTCGTVHQNDFANRFAIIDDREACIQFLDDCRERIRQLQGKISAIETQIGETDSAISDIDSMLSEARGEVTLKEVIETEGRRTALELFRGQISDLDEKVGTLSSKLTEIDAGLAELRDPRRKEEIEGFYAGQISRYLDTLDVKNIDHASVSKIVNRIHETGSDQPRAVLAYYLALLHTVYRYSTALTAPMVIDSPNQQDQDTTNVARMIALVISSRPENGQTIMATVSLHGQTVEDGKVITFEHKNSVLVPDTYSSVSDRMEPMLARMHA